MTGSVTGIRRRRTVAGRRETSHLPPDRAFYGQTLISLPLRSFVLREVILPILIYGIFGSAQYMLLAELVVVCFGRKKVV